MSEQIKNQSTCPVCVGLDIIGDKWNLLIIRDMLLYKKQQYNEFLESAEGISTNILADRLRVLEQGEMLSRQQSPADKRQFVYAPTQKTMDLLPVVIQIILWGDIYKTDPIPRDMQPWMRLMKRDPEKLIESIRSSFALNN